MLRMSIYYILTLIMLCYNKQQHYLPSLHSRCSYALFIKTDNNILAIYYIVSVVTLYERIYYNR